jgi:addiction module HigA family antidote
VTQVEAAERMHMPTVRLNQLIRGNRGVTPDTALHLADLTGTSAEFWMNLQCRYDLWNAEQARLERKESKIRALATGKLTAMSVYRDRRRRTYQYDFWYAGRHHKGEHISGERG